MSHKSTIFIPDISGYTKFLTTTEINHATHIINELLEIIVKENNQLFEIGEIEGDAVLMHKSGDPPKISELNRHCLKIFRAFHEYLKVIERDRLCNCGACTGASNLDLKFIAHYGDVSTISVGGFTKASGLALIVAHRLLKNSISGDGYIMYSKDLLDVAVKDEGWEEGLGWFDNSDSYEAIGEVHYSYSQLEEVKEGIPDLAANQDVEPAFIDDAMEIEINAGLTEVYHKLLDPRTKEHWVGGMKEIRAEADIDRINTSHVCVLEGVTAEITMVGGSTNDQEITLLDKARVPEMNLEMFNYYKLTQLEKERTHLNCRLAPADGYEFSPEISKFMVDARRADLERFKAYCEN